MDGGGEDRASNDYLGPIPAMEQIGFGRMVVVGASRTPRERKYSPRERKYSKRNGPLPPPHLCNPSAIPKLPTRWRAGAKRLAPLPSSAPHPLPPPRDGPSLGPLQTPNS